MLDLPEPSQSKLCILGHCHRKVTFCGPTSDASCLRLGPASAFVFDKAHLRWTQRVPLPLGHPAIHGEVDAKFTVIVLWVSESVKHCGTQKLDSHGRVSLVSNSRETAHNRQPVKRFVNGFHA